MDQKVQSKGKMKNYDKNYNGWTINAELSTDRNLKHKLPVVSEKEQNFPATIICIYCKTKPQESLESYVLNWKKKTLYLPRTS